LPGVNECIELNLDLGRRTNPGIRCVGVSVNTMALTAGERAGWLRELSKQTGLPCANPLVDGPGAIVDELLNPSKKGKK
jgi:uncharacterized NAD-dependent epimerase/dehydratase family protein